MTREATNLESGPGLLYRAEGADRVVVLFHGAGGEARQAIDLLRSQADGHRLAVVAPKSAGPTWDLLMGGLGPDLDAVNRAIEEISAAVPGPVAIGGFSDGASYALSLGLAAGDQIESVIAFSPGFMAPPQLRGKPRVFISHGNADPVLPIDRCGRRVVAQLTEAGYELVFHQFVGGHEVPAEVRRAAAEWLTAS